jgi:hypothetical protein
MSIIKHISPPYSVEDSLPREILPTFHPWPEDHFRPASHLRAGALLGCMAGCVTLMANVIGSTAWSAISGEPQHPLRLIQVFLTFPFGRAALQLSGGWLLAAGCILFLVTGMLYGMLFEYLVSYFLPHADVRTRIAVFSLFALGVWVVNFYALLMWLQPLLFGGRWITELVPWWVAAITHLLFGVTMGVIYPLGSRITQRAYVPLSSEY